MYQNLKNHGGEYSLPWESQGGIGLVVRVVENWKKNPWIIVDKKSFNKSVVVRVVGN